jgi:hypothetical protein
VTAAAVSIAGVALALTATDPGAAHAAAFDVAAEPGATGTPGGCLTRVGVEAMCSLALPATAADATAAEAPEAALVTASAGVPPGLRVEADGRITGTPTTPGIYELRVALDDGGAGELPITVSDVDFLATTISVDQKTVTGIRWNGTRVTLATAKSNALNDKYVGAGIGPDGTVYVVTRTQLQRVVSPNATQTLLQGLEATAADIAPSGDVHIATRLEILTYRDGAEIRRPRTLTTSDVVEDAAGDLWTVEPRRVLKQDLETGEITTYPFTDIPRALTASRGSVYVAVDGHDPSVPNKVHALDFDGTVTATLTRGQAPANRIAFSELLGLVFPSEPGNREFSWSAPIDAGAFLPESYRSVSVPRHLRFVEPPAHPLQPAYEIAETAETAPDRLRLAHHPSVTWRGGSERVQVAADGRIVRLAAAPPGSEVVIAEATAPGLTTTPVPVRVTIAGDPATR